MTVTDDEDPTIVGLPADIEDCGPVEIFWEEPSYTDNCFGGSIVQSEGLAIGSIFPVGETSITYTATDAAGNEVSASFTVLVKELPIIVSDVADQSVVYGCDAPLLSITASLEDEENNPAISYQWYKASNEFGDNAVPLNGETSSTYQTPHNYNVGDYFYYVEVSANSCPVQSRVAKVSITQQLADAINGGDSYYTGPNVAWTPTSTSNTATVTLSAFLQNSDEPGSECGDIATAKVSFYVNNNVIASAKDLPVNYVDPSNPAKGGTAAAIVQLNISNNVSSEIFDIKVVISGNYNAADVGGQVSQILVGKLIPGGAIGGGAKLSNTNSSGFIKGASTKRTTATFGVEYKTKGKSVSSPSGRVTLYIPSYNDRYGNPTEEIHWYFVKSNAIASLTITSPEATFTSKSNVAEYDPCTGTLSPIEGNCTMVIDMKDVSGNSPNYSDQVGVTVYRNAGGVWYSNNWVTSKTVKNNICGGDVSVTGICTASFTAKIANDSVDTLANDELFEGYELESWPNPAKNQFNLKWRSENRVDKIEVQVLDLNGRQVYHNLHDANTDIQIGNNFNAGMYIVRVNQAGIVKTIKLIKQ